MLEGWGESTKYEFTNFNKGWLLKILIFIIYILYIFYLQYSLFIIKLKSIYLIKYYINIFKNYIYFIYYLVQIIQELIY